MPRPAMAIAILVAAINVTVHAVRASTIDISVADENGNQLPARVHLADSSDKPQKANSDPFWNDHFVCDGKATANVQPGEFTWVIERGPEYEHAKGKLAVAKNETAKLDVTLHRIATLRDEGWYSGDLHVHRSTADIKTLMMAEDLDFALVITWWNRPSKDAKPAEQTVFQFDGHRIYQSVAGEDEREGGALLYFGLKKPLDLTVSSREYPSPMAFVRLARQLNSNVWIDIEKPFWWDVPMWLASGQMNSIGIANNHMCRSQMYEDEAWGKPRDAARLPDPRGNGFWTQEIYYHILNSGLHLPPSAGSASGVLPNPVGYNRVYVHLDKPFTCDNWFQALSKGNSFVTNGPLLRATANEKIPGETFKLNGPTLDVSLDINLTSRDRVSQIEVIHNGSVVSTFSCGEQTSHDISRQFAVSKPGWFLVRAIADVDHTFRFASTAPWFIESDAQPTYINKRSAQFFLDWVDERIDRVKKNVADPLQQAEVLEPHERAREFWTERVQNATD
ncbi:MAG: CehA/McbA family metallohydrolase [Planctomycetales bacterium]|nr:CehA/McbA family metallohydrolase [Planctomycetales bacterium]